MDTNKVNMLKACIMSRKGGIPLIEVTKDYKNLVGEDIPFTTMGFKTLSEYLTSIPDIKIVSGLVQCSCKETAHIEAMIARQKNPITKNSRYANKRKCDYEAFNPTAKKKYQPSTSTALLPNLNNESSSGFIRNFNYHMNNLSYEEFDCIYNEWNQLHNLIYSLLFLMELNKVNISSVTDIMQNTRFTVNNMKNNRKSGLVLYGYQVIGDGCALKMIGGHAAVYRGGSGTCSLGLTLNEAHNQIINVTCMSKVLIMCGSVDLYKGIPLCKMIQEMQELLLSVMLSGSVPVVCTLPPSPWLWLNHHIQVYNHWLRTLTSIQLVDLYPLFLTSAGQVKYYFFERIPIIVDRMKFFLWSDHGNTAVKQLLFKELNS